jgi:hypothetical protein
MGAAGNTASTHWYVSLGDAKIISINLMMGVRFSKSGENPPRGTAVMP